MYAELRQIDTLKKCGTCKEYKIKIAFTKDVRSKDGLHFRCKMCRKNYRRREEVKKSTSEYNKEYAAKHPEQMISKDRRSSLKRFWGMTLGEYDELLKSQNGVCAVCGSESKNVSQRYKNLCIDHDHKTGRIRGLLCDRCNRALGLLNDSPDLLYKAISYLTKS